ncbi:hypothetical protein KBY71_09280 [Cyanobium sp. T1B-Tous]|uniref:virulence-associated E family protein n=1 Tax=Cyanobium sp. T1B-Tous TaxID=2823721 RepID=UPI0020CC0711|nr:virulence-associated E family protein [Cyanobium sp. T1B-Tous]MCP9806704.1 hypothetical protein [Cyanobium sp. T1B-Tous]
MQSNSIPLHDHDKTDPDPKVWRRHWRRQLWRIKDLPLIAVGGGQDRKAPANLRTGEPLQNWQRTTHDHTQIESASPRVCGAGLHTGRWGADKHSILVADIDGAAAVEHCLAHSCDPQATLTWQTHRNTDACRLKVKFRLTPEQADQLGNVKTSRLLKEAIKDEAGNVLAKAEALEIFHQPNSQVVVLGEHPTSKGFYFWPDDMGPEALAPITPEWWALVLDVIQNDVAPPSRKATSKAPRSSAGEWGNCNPCPICGRNTSNWCSRHRSTGAINCRHGNTFSPEQSHGVLRLGDTITGTDGTVYAFCGTETQSDNWRFSKFVIDKPWERSAAPDCMHGFKVNPDGFALTAAEIPADIEPPPPPASFQALIQLLSDGWNGKGTHQVMAPGQLADVLPQDRLRFNEMDLRAEVHTTSGWQRITDACLDSAYVLLTGKGWRIAAESVVKAVLHVARQSPHHPIRDYLQQIESDPTITPFDLDQVAPRFFRATNALHVAMIRKWLIGAVARTLKPGCQMDYCLVLKGSQGQRKSRSLEALASKEWHCSSVPESEKDLLLNVHSTWIYELAELESVTSRKEAGRLKNLITTSVDNLRPPYGRTTERLPRQSVFAATVNAETFLRDDTGNRRFWVVPVEGPEALDRDGIAAARDAIWKAAVIAFRSEELPMLPPAMEALSAAQNEDFNDQDLWDEKVLAWMDGKQMVSFDPDRDPSPLRYDPHQPFTSAEVLYSAGLKRSEQIIPADYTRIGKVLRRVGFTQLKQQRVGGVRVRRWSPSQPSQPSQPPAPDAVTPPTACAAMDLAIPSQPSQPFSGKREKEEQGEQGTVERTPSGLFQTEVVTPAFQRPDPLQPKGSGVSQPPAPEVVTSARFAVGELVEPGPDAGCMKGVYEVVELDGDRVVLSGPQGPGHTRLVIVPADACEVVF